MKRTQVQLDEATYEALRRKAFEQGSSIAAIVREILAESLGTYQAGRRRSMEDFTFVGIGRSRQGRQAPVSERHDEALAEIWKKGPAA